MKMKSKILMLGTLLLMLSCQKGPETISFEDCNGNTVSSATINEKGLFIGKSLIDKEKNQFQIKWKVRRNGDFEFSHVANWKFYNDGKDFLYIYTGYLLKEKAQIIFYREPGQKKDLELGIEGTKQAISEKYNDVKQIEFRRFQNLVYVEYDFKFENGDDGHYLELLAYEKGFKLGVGYYFKSDSRLIHKRMFFYHLTNVNYKNEPFFNRVDLLSIMPVEICSYEKKKNLID